MATMVHIFVFLMLTGISHVIGDYPCLCSYQVELEIYSQPDTSSNVDGYMYEFDCKPSYPVPGLDPKFSAIGNDGKLGYVVMSSNIQIQKCQGSVPTIDKVVITQAPTTPEPTTTTTTPRPTTTTTTPRPTTTPMPTTTTTTPMPTTTTTPVPTTKITTRRPTTITTTPMPTTKTTTRRPTTTTTTPVPTTATPVSLCQTFGIQSSLVSSDGASCYEFVNKTDNWMNAKKDCQKKGGFLVSILNLNQQNFVANFLLQIHMRKPVWIGFTDSVSEEHWKWDSGDNATYYNWMPGRLISQYHDIEDCGLFVPLRKNQWDDVQCSGLWYGNPIRHPWICQYS